LIAVAAAFACVGLNARSWGRPVLTVGAIYVLFLFPILGFFNVYFMRYSQAADHFQYLALLAPCAFGGALFAGIAKRTRFGIAAQIAAVLLVSIYAGLTWRHARVFQSNERLWRHAIEKNPRAWMAHNNLGLIYFDRGQYAEAESHFRAAIAANPRHYEALCNLGAVALRLDRPAEAREALEEAVRWQPRLPQAWYNLGRAHERLGNREAAREAHHRALDVNPEMAEAHARLALLSEEDGDYVTAVRHHVLALRAVSRDPLEHARFLNERAIHYMSKQRLSAARTFLGASQKAAPDFEETRQLEAALQRLQQLPAGDNGSN
jgi:tetratricopeptide (TPR) repeat protein